MQLKCGTLPPLLIASDAQASPEEGASAAFLVIDPVTNARWGRVWTFSREDLDSFGFPDWPRRGPVREDRNPISACEAAAVAATYWMVAVSGCLSLHGRDVVHWVDNTAALHSLVKGGSKNIAIDRACNIVWISSFVWGFTPWFEYVASKANWSDGASRDLLDDPFAREHGFELSIGEFPMVLWSCGLSDLWNGLVGCR